MPVSASFSQVLDFALNQPFLILVIPLLLLLINTRLRSTLAFRSSLQRSASGPSPAPTLPYNVPFVGHAISFATGLNTFLSSRARAYPTLPAFALKLGGSRHNVIIAPSLTHHILTARNVPLHMHELIYRVIETFWGDRKKTIRALPGEFVWGDLHKILSGMMRETFVTSSLAATVDSVQNKILDLVSGNDSIVDQQSWERTAKVTIIPQPSTHKTSQSFVAEADLYLLLRDFVGSIATTVLMGTDFLANYPDTLPDLWTADNQFNTFLSGLPDWVPALQSPSRARNRLVEAVRQHHIAYLKYRNGQDPGTMWANISNTSTVMAERALGWDRIVRQAGADPNGLEAGRGDASLVWAMNVNSNQVIFWMIFYIFSSPDLLAQIRDEIAPHMKTTAPPSSLPIQSHPDINIDLNGLRTKCPLLQGAFLETMRLEAASMSYKYVEEDFSVTESEEDARIFKHEKPQTHVFRKGEYICIPHGIHQSDPRYFSHPDVFDPRRFWVTPTSDKAPVDADGNTVPSDDDNDNSHPCVSYGTMKVWGGGREVCKGRKFAEGEVALFVAAVVWFWDMEPIDRYWQKTAWVHPGRKEAAGAVKPKNEVRVRIWRRDVDGGKDQEQTEEGRKRKEEMDRLWREELEVRKRKAEAREEKEQDNGGTSWLLKYVH